MSPYTCECNHGYVSLNETCEPVCSEPCINGDCVAPETCNCLPGFRRSQSNSCEPYCSTGCDNGDCVAPETCHCNPGWLKVNNSLNVETCMPLCNETCSNESCGSQDNCVCKPGYVKSGNNKCSFRCTKCLYGECIGTEKCACSAGWKLNEDETDCVSYTDITSTTKYDDVSTDITLANVETTRELIVYSTNETETNLFNLSVPNLLDPNSDDSTVREITYPTSYDASSEM